MPKFEAIPVAEARMKTASGKRVQIIAEYVRYIEQLGAGEAGRLQAVEGEKLSTVRRRLGDAARQLEKKITIAERVTRYISGRRSRVGEGADDQRPDDQPWPRARARIGFLRSDARYQSRTRIVTALTTSRGDKWKPCPSFKRGNASGFVKRAGLLLRGLTRG